MKTKIMFGLLLSGLFVANLSFGQAQPAIPAVPQDAKVMKLPVKMADAATRADKMVKRLTNSLGLDAATAQKLAPLALARAQKIDAIQAGTTDSKAKGQALKLNAEDFETKLQTVLSADQFAKYKEMKRGKGGRDGDGRDKNKDEKDSN